MPHKVLVSRYLPTEALDRLRSAAEVDYHDGPDGLPKGELIKRVSGKDGLVCHITDAVDEEVLSAAPRLRVVSNVAVGYNNIDIGSAKRHNVVVTNTPDVLTETTADFAWTLMMATGRRVVEADKFVRAGRWSKWDYNLLLGTDIFGATLGIVGFGRIGRAMARRALGFKMRVLYHDVHRAEPAAERELNASYAELETILRESDFITLHTLLNPGSQHLIGADALKLMKPTAYLINAARGPIVDEAALVDALSHNRLAGAGLDVFENEPKVHPGLLSLDNVVLAPHIASASHATRIAMAMLAVNNCLAVLDGKPALTPVK
jgi:glyoxylate reductase